MTRRSIKIAAASAAAVGALGIGGATMALAADSATPTPNPSASASGDAVRQGHGASTHTAVTGAEADKVIAAVKAKDSAAMIATVREDADGSYDALGSKAGAPVVFEVSKDLKTIEARTRGGKGGPGARDGSTSGCTTPGHANGTSSTTSGTTDATATAV